MVEKLKVRRLIASYERKFTEEIKKTEEELNKKAEECSVSKMTERFWYDSKEREILVRKLAYLRETRNILQDIRCDELLN